MRKNDKIILFDWGDTVMRVFSDYTGPMYLWEKIEVLPELSPVLERLGEIYRVYLATNSKDSTEQNIFSALKRGGISGYFSGIFCYKTIGYLKPSPEFFHSTQRTLNAKPEDMVFVGDSFDSDITGAVKAGIYGIWYNEKTFENRQSAGYCTIHSFDQLEPALEKVFNR